MKAKVRMGDLNEALTQLQYTLDRSVGSPTSQLFLQFVIKEKDSSKGREKDEHYLYGFTTNIRTRTLVKVPAQVEEKGSVLTDLRMLKDFLTGRPGEDLVELTLDEAKVAEARKATTPSKGKKAAKYEASLQVKYKRSLAHLPVGVDLAYMDSQRQKLPFQEPPAVRVKAADLFEFCRRTLFCVPSDSDGQVGQVVGGIHITADENGYEAQATDGIVAGRVQIAAEKHTGIWEDFMIPLKSVNPINHLLSKRQEQEVDVILGPATEHGRGEVFFRLGDILFGTQLLVGKFPPLKKMLEATVPKYSFDVDRNELRMAISRAAAYLGRDRNLTLEMKKDLLGIKVENGLAKLEDELDIEAKNTDGVTYKEPVKIMVALDYLSNIATHASSERLILGVTNPTSALVVQDDADERVKSKYLLMPIQP